jgi:hypothetical protein
MLGRTEVELEESIALSQAGAEKLEDCDALSQASTEEQASVSTIDSISDGDGGGYLDDAASECDQESLASDDTGELATCGECRSTCTADLRQVFEDQGSFSDCDSLVWSDDDLSDVFSMVEDDDPGCMDDLDVIPF